MFQQRDFHDFCTLSYNPSKTMQIYENSTLKTIVSSNIFIKNFHPSLTFHPPYSFNPKSICKNVTKLQSYRITKLHFSFSSFDVFVGMEGEPNWMDDWSRREGR